MPDHDDFAKFETEFLGLARRIFDAGAQAERSRVVALIQGGGNFTAVAQVVHRPRSRMVGYGKVSGRVRDALTALAVNLPDGVSVSDIEQHFQRLGAGPDKRQIRAALKSLTITGDANRAARGKYLPHGAAVPPPSGETPDDDASGDFQLAAE
jgi:hypothetical protein